MTFRITIMGTNSANENATSAAARNLYEQSGRASEPVQTQASDVDSMGVVTNDISHERVRLTTTAPATPENTAPSFWATTANQAARATAALNASTQPVDADQAIAAFAKVKILFDSLNPSLGKQSGVPTAAQREAVEGAYAAFVQAGTAVAAFIATTPHQGLSDSLGTSLVSAMFSAQSEELTELVGKIKEVP